MKQTNGLQSHMAIIVGIMYLGNEHYDGFKNRAHISTDVEAPLFVSTGKKNNMNAYGLNPVLLYLRLSKLEI